MATIRDVVDLSGPLPLPQRLDPRWGRLDLDRGLRISGPAHASVGLRRLLRRHQRRFDGLLAPATPDAPVLQIQADADPERAPSLGDDERYRLRVTSSGAEIDAATCFGVSHGLERLLQFVARDGRGAHVPAFVIEDAPHLPWRGLLLDLARHHMPLATLLRTLDGMAALGLNVLHLHLNDDQGFRIETPGCPELFERGAQGAYLRVGEIERLVADAAIRGIRIVPELDVPGHAGAIVHARPELAAGVPPDALPRAFGPSRHALDPTLDATWETLDAVVADLVALFPDRYLHIGGDEVHPEVYVFKDARRLQWCAERGLHAARDVQRWFEREMAGVVRRHGRRAVAWDEVLAPDLPEDVIVQSWRGSSSLGAALTGGHDALSSSGYYLDLNYPARVHYAFDPASGPEGLALAEAQMLDAPRLASVRRGIQAVLRTAPSAPERLAPIAGRVLGGEACMWSELVTPELLDARLYGRLAAVAERLWTDPARCDADDFERRLPALLAHLEAHTDCRPLSGNEPLLLRMGVRPDELHHLRIALAAFEPVRWYRRLLGEALAIHRGEGSGMGSAELPRPYDADTELRRPVDLLPPESLDVLAFARELAAFAAAPDQPSREMVLRDRAHRWRMAQVSLHPLQQRNADFATLAPLIDLLAPVADLLDAWTETRARGGDETALGAKLAALGEQADAAVTAEIELAVLTPLRDHVGRRHG